MPERKPTAIAPAGPASPVFSARVAGDGTGFEAPAALPLLLAAEQAGVWLRDSSCRNGTCRTCLCRLVSGQVVYRIDWPGLSRDEKRDGFILPCVAYPASDVVIESIF
ncbi:2Fe-2S iron-sulfur cluster binding domain-containing protein [Polaromonas sp. CG_9.11]|uniref:2Fe-2S iron-sulfur cluster-binding protein n=1 Tax=Polaromonas sp. CG_9.11 TaxID=2787730 RepID=UPI0018CB0C89|nr:2Fe-2S iron-sulfur cluster binding domain-containing protein [Polaromonas sp. CG_9.11]MBG6076143.1 ferredoxin [Polaromonas sp. CG_9.11]